MSRIGRKPIKLPKGVEAQIGTDTIKIKGPLGELTEKLPPYVSISQDGGIVSVASDEDAPKRKGGAMQGLTRALVANMVVGVTEGYTKSLDLVGVGYRAKGTGNKLSLALGFTEPVVYSLPSGVSWEIKNTRDQKENRIILKGIDKAVLGQIAADLRRLRPPEPYKGKGIRYTDERIRHKAGKAGAR